VSHFSPAQASSHVHMAGRNMVPITYVPCTQSAAQTCSGVYMRSTLSHFLPAKSQPPSAITRLMAGTKATAILERPTTSLK